MVDRMAGELVWFFVFFLSSFETLPQATISVQGNSHAFIHTNNDVRYLVDGIPVPVHKDLSNTQGVGTGLEENSLYGSKSHLRFDPPLLDFKQRHLGMPHHEKVTLFNVNSNKTIHMSSISGNTVHFHSSFFEHKVIPPRGNTTFNVVFLGREEGEIESNLFIHTSEGSFKYRVKGASVSSPYRLRPLVGIRVPLNSTYSPLIYVHNPHTFPIQIIEVYSSGGEFHLELPSGELEGPKYLWEVPPFFTKPIIRVRFVARAEKNHTAYVRIKLNKSEEVLVVPLEVEVTSQPGLYSLDDTIDFGVGGSYNRPKKVKLALYNSLKKVIRIQNVATVPFSKAVKIDFQPIKVPPGSSSPTHVATLTFDWHTAFETSDYNGKIVIKSKQNQQKLVIPYIAQVLEGGLDYNTSVTQYCSSQPPGIRNFTVRNVFKVPVALVNVSLSSEADEYFIIQNFSPVILNSGDSVVLFQLLVRRENLPSDLKLKAYLLLHTNISTISVPVLCYSGKIIKIILSDSNETELNFGTVGSASQREAHFALYNNNPVPIVINSWSTNLTGAVVDLLGVTEGNYSSLEERQHFKDLNPSSLLRPNCYAVFQVAIVAPNIEEIFSASILVKTQYENISLPVKMQVAHGRLEVLPDPLILNNCFPGKLCKQTLQIRSLFSRPMMATSVTTVPYDPRISYWNFTNSSSEIIPLATSTIGELRFDPASNCGSQCYLGVNATAGSQWLQLLELPPHVHEIDLSLLSVRYANYVRLAGEQGLPVRQNISLQLHTTEVRRHIFSAKIIMQWPLLSLNVALSPGNTSVLAFPLTQVGNVTYKDLIIHNPSSKPLILQLVMDWADRFLHDLPDGLSRCHECANSPSREFTLEAGKGLVGSFVHKLLGVTPHPNSIALILQAGEMATTRLGFFPQKAGLSSAVLLIRNNLTILEIVQLSGRAAHAQFKFGNRKPGSDAPLMFELAEKHLRDCEREKHRKFPMPNLTVKRSFTARNTGELPIYVSGFKISGLPCEGFGFRVLNCMPFQLPPNGTRKVDIAFTPDFTLARIQRSLSIDTNLGVSVNYSLITTLPPYFLASCSSVLGRPTWEPLLYYSALSFLTFILFCVLAAAFLESDRILKYTFVAAAKDKALQAIVEMKVPNITSKNGDIKSTYGKSENVTDWNINGSVPSQSEKKRDCSTISIAQVSHSCQKISWTNLEDKHIESEIKDKSCLNSPPSGKVEDRNERIDLDIGYSSNSTPLMTVKNKKKLSKKNSNSSEPSLPEQSTENSLVKKGWSSFLSRSPNQSKSKLNTIENKICVNKSEIEVSSKKIIDISKEIKRSSQTQKKNKQVSEPILCSEEDTSSTTTESSNNEEVEKERDPISCRGNKVTPKNDKEKVIDYKDNYEGDCDDDDDYDQGQKKKEYNNHWKTNSKTLNGKSISETTTKVTNLETSKPTSLELPYKLKSSKTIGRERKEKNVLKKRTGEKSGSMKVITLPNTSNCTNINSAVRISPPLRTAGSCWGEHRASFSDVVARTDSTLYSNIVAPRKRPQSSSSPGFSDGSRIRSSEVSSSSSSSLGPIGSKKPSSSWDVTESQQSSLSPFHHHNSQETSSLFSDISTETANVDQDEEKINTLPYTGESVWEQSNSIMPLLEENNRKASTEYSQDLFQESWPGVDSLWGSLYSPPAESSQLFTPSLQNEDVRGTGSVWGSLIGSVWSSSTWSSAPGPVAPPLSSVQNHVTTVNNAAGTSSNTSNQRPVRMENGAPEDANADVDQGLGFDPFRSLNTIWFPASSDSWTSSGNNGT